MEFPFPNINKNEEVKSVTQKNQNIISIYIPDVIITCEARNSLRINEKVKKLVLHKKCAYSASSQDRNNNDLFNKLQSLPAHLKITIGESKQTYYHAYLINHKVTLIVTFSESLKEVLQ